MLRNYLEILFHEIKYSNHSYGLSHMDWYLSGWLNNEFFSGDIIANKAAKKSVERLAFHTKLITGPVNRDTPSYTEAKLFFSGKSCFMLKIFHHFREEIFKWWLFNIFASLKESWKDYIWQLYWLIIHHHLQCLFSLKEIPWEINLVPDREDYFARPRN